MSGLIETHDQALSEGRFVKWCAAAVLAGFAVRLAPFIGTDFPLNDGGLFTAMVDAIRSAHLRLPETVYYNPVTIPFAYPPLAFLVAAVLGASTGVSTVELMRILPFVFSALCVVAFCLFARAVAGTSRAAVVACFAFALIPRSFSWLIMGGGLTRAGGLLFALLALASVVKTFTRSSRRSALWAAIFSALTVVTHAETAWCLFYSAALLTFCTADGRRNIRLAAVIALGTAVLSAIWWGLVLSRYGFSPLKAAMTTGGLKLIVNGLGDGADHSSIVQFVSRMFGASTEPLFPFFIPLTLVGFVCCVSSKRIVLPLWWLGSFVFDIRSGATIATIPGAVIIGLAVSEMIVPYVSRAAPHAEPETLSPKSRGLLCAFALLGFLAAVVPAPYHETGESLTQADRSAMSWAEQHTPPESRFLIITGAPWYLDRWGEWFPVLARRAAITTVQGREWLSNEPFSQVIRRNFTIQTCAVSNVICVNNASAEFKLDYTHLYVPNRKRFDYSSLVNSLAADNRYKAVYTGPGGTIFEFHK